DGFIDASVQSHLSACASCRARLAGLEAAAAAVGNPPLPLDDDTVERLISTALAAAAIDDLAPVLPLQPERQPRLMWLAAAAAAVVLMAGVGAAVTPAGRPSPPKAPLPAPPPTAAAASTPQALAPPARAVPGAN